MALEAGIRVGSTPVARMAIPAVGVTLPDLDAQAGEGLSVDVQYAAREIRQPSLGHAGSSANPGQIVVVIQRQLRRIERAGRLTRSPLQELGRESRSGNEGAGDTQQHEPSTVIWHRVHVGNAPL